MLQVCKQEEQGIYFPSVTSQVEEERKTNSGVTTGGNAVTEWAGGRALRHLLYFWASQSLPFQIPPLGKNTLKESRRVAEPSK